MVWLDNSRLLAVLAVVVLHTAAYVVTGSDVGSQYWWFGNIYDSLVRWSVPVFVMISGALLCDPGKEEGLTAFYKKRLSRIAIPILFWSAFFLLWQVLKGMIDGAPPSPAYLLNKLVSGKPYYHLWFLYMILSLYLFTPFFRKIVSNSSERDLTIFATLALSLAALNGISGRLDGDSKLFLNWFLHYIPYFFIGYLIRISERRIPQNILWAIFLVSCASTALGCYFVARNHGLYAGIYFYGYLSVTVIPMSCSIMGLLRSLIRPLGGEKRLKTLSSLTLGIYLIHPILLEAVSFLGFGPLKYHPAVSIPIDSIVVFSLSLACSWIIYQLPYLRRVI